MAQKFYAVRAGRKPGIYMSWEACKTQVHGFAGAQYKSFTTREDADEYMSAAKCSHVRSEAFAFVDVDILNEPSTNANAVMSDLKHLHLLMVHLIYRHQYMVMADL